MSDGLRVQAVRMKLELELLDFVRAVYKHMMDRPRG